MDTLQITQGSATFDGAFLQFDVGGSWGTMYGSAGNGTPVVVASGPGIFEVFPSLFSGQDASITYNGELGVLQGFGDSSVGFDGVVNVTHPGVYTSPFTADLRFACGPCFGSDLFSTEAQGSGTMTSTWNETSDGLFYMSAPAHYSFSAPEPGSFSMMAIALAALACTTLIQRYRARMEARLYG